jgi:prepilin-type N-terminal cleavage/methylation domain-containing protein
MKEPALNTHRTRGRTAFTLVEILIVVIILGVLAAIITPHFTGAVTEAEIGTTSHELAKLRRAIEVYQISNHNVLPDVAEGDGTWGELTSGNQYLKSPPVNPYVGGANAAVIVFRNAPDVAYQRAYGWIYDAATGQVWAGSFDSSDLPIAP